MIEKYVLSLLQFRDVLRLIQLDPPPLVVPRLQGATAACSPYQVLDKHT
jgi:hypothetical protein